MAQKNWLGAEKNLGSLGGRFFSRGKTRSCVTPVKARQDHGPVSTGQAFCGGQLDRRLRRKSAISHEGVVIDSAFAVADTSDSVRQGTTGPRQGNNPTCFD